MTNIYSRTQLLTIKLVDLPIAQLQYGPPMQHAILIEALLAWILPRRHKPTKLAPGSATTATLRIVARESCEFVGGLVFAVGNARTGTAPQPPPAIINPCYTRTPAAHKSSPNLPNLAVLAPKRAHIVYHSHACMVRTHTEVFRMPLYMLVRTTPQGFHTAAVLRPRWCACAAPHQCIPLQHAQH